MPCLQVPVDDTSPVVPPSSPESSVSVAAVRASSKDRAHVSERRSCRQKWSTARRFNEPSSANSRTSNSQMLSRELHSGIVWRTSEWPLVHHDARFSGTATSRLSGTSRNSAAPRTGQRVSANLDRQSQRLQRTSNAMPEPAVLGLFDLIDNLFSGQPTQPVSPEETPASSTATANPPRYMTAPVSSTTVVATPISSGITPLPSNIVLKPKAIQLAMMMDSHV